MSDRAESSQRMAALLLRIGLLGAAALCWMSAWQLWSGANLILQRGPLALSMLLYALAALLLILACLRRVPAQAHWLILLSVLLYTANVWISREAREATNGVRDQTDVHLFSDYAATLVRLGENPYRYDMLDAFRVYRSTLRSATPRLDGDYVGRVSYPAFAIELYLPFQWLHIDTTLIYPLFFVATVLLLYAASPPWVRPIILLVFLLNPNYILFSFSNLSDIVWAFLLALMVYLRPQTVWGALCFGLACAFKQQPWFLAPFLLVPLWWESAPQHRIRTIGRFILVSSGVFVLLNLPFIISDPQAWFDGITYPLTQPMIVLGQGLSLLTLEDITLMPKALFSVLTYGTLLGGWLLYARWYRQWPYALWLFPAVALWFGHRSLASYWHFYLIPLLVAVLLAYRRAEIPALDDLPSLPRAFTRTLIAAGAALVIVTGGAILLFASQEPLTLAVQYPVYYGGTRTRVIVNATNHTNEIITPRFSLQSWSDQPYFWDQQQGSGTLNPGETAQYVLSTDLPFHLFGIAQGARVMMTDASNYDLRAAALLEPVQAPGYLDVPTNGDFRYWNIDARAPYGWSVITQGPQNAVFLETDAEQGNVLRMTISAPRTSLQLDTWLMLPSRPLTIRINVPQAANRPEDDFAMVYGVKLVSTLRNEPMLVLFGDHEETGTLPSDELNAPPIPYVMLSAPRGVWSEQALDIGALFEQAGLKQPAPMVLPERNLEFPMPMYNLRLYLASQIPTDAHFGLISVPVLDPDTDALIQQVVQSPQQVALWRGDLNRKADNIATARDAYDAVLAAEPNNAAALYGLGLLILPDDPTEALIYFNRALEAGYAQPILIYESMGQAYLLQGDDTAAQAIYEKAIDMVNDPPALTPTRVRAALYKGLGQALLNQDRATAAETALNQALVLDAWDVDIYDLLQEASLQQNRCNSAAAYQQVAQQHGFQGEPLICDAP